MKLSATTRSTAPPAEISFVAAPRTPVPSVMRTRATIASGNAAPTNDKPAASERTGAETLPRLCPFTSKNSIVEAAATSTSLNTTPKPVTSAGVGCPAEVTGFGVVFSDVDVAAASTIEFFDVNGQSLGRDIH